MVTKNMLVLTMSSLIIFYPSVPLAGVELAPVNLSSHNTGLAETTPEIQS